MDVKEVFQIALTAGEILLKSGAETNRVEETVLRICKCYNIECECFATTTGLFISTGTGIFKEKDTITLLKRVSNRSVDLHRIELVNSFSRNLENETLSYNDAMKMLKDITNLPYFNFPLRLISAAATAFIYTLIIKGSILDGISASIVCSFIYILKEYLFKYGTILILDSFLSGFIAGILSIISSKFISIDIGSVITGSIMILFPGLIITAGIKDAINGDMVSCTSRLAEALFIVASIGAGVAVSLIIGINNLQVII